MGRETVGEGTGVIPKECKRPLISARTDLSGGYRVTGIPTATASQRTVIAGPRYSGCHPEPFACHPERSEGSRYFAQGKLSEGSRGIFLAHISILSCTASKLSDFVIG